MFDQMRPCKTCPFSKKVKPFLSKERISEIAESSAFQCHNTVDYSNSDNENGEGRQGNKPQQCAGLMTILHKTGRPNVIMRVAMAWGDLKPSKLDPHNEAHDCLEDAAND
jgi:hypothetical protein